MRRFYVLVGCFPKQWVRNNWLLLSQSMDRTFQLRKWDPDSEVYVLNHAEKSEQWGVFEKQRNLSGPINAGENHGPQWAPVRRSVTLQLCIRLSALPVPSRLGDPGAGTARAFSARRITDTLETELTRLRQGSESQPRSATFCSWIHYQIVKCFHWPITTSLQMSEFSLTYWGQSHDKLLPTCAEFHFVLIHGSLRDLLKSLFMDSTSWWFPEINEPGFQGMQMSSNLQPASRLPAKVS